LDAELIPKHLFNSTPRAKKNLFLSGLFTFGLFYSYTSFSADTFRIAAYNVENYLDQPTESRKFTKAADAKAKVRESIKAMNPDVISFEEMGSTNALLELRASLKADGLDFPYWEHIQAGIRTSTSPC